MRNKKLQVSIITVNYKVEEELVACISSIVNSKPKVGIEIIVVDNDEDGTLKKILKEEYPQVRYVRSSGNIGFGAGNNLGAKLATSDFLFFLNPDTIVEKDSIDVLFNFVKDNSKSGMVAPLLFDLLGNVYANQGSDQYNLKSAIVTSSFIDKLFPNNPISRKFFHKDWNKENIHEFDVIPGTAFMIKKNIFEKVGMFDESFFLYFEEYDLAKRLKKLGYKNYIIPEAKVLHVWEASAKKRKDINKIFSESRYFFFKKHYGVFFASIINVVSSFGRYELMLGLTLVLSTFLCLFKIKTLMTFIGDQGWFYLSARNMVISGQVPLVGIASSHPWLHQGPFWTYLLASFLWMFNFNPVSGAYLTMILGTLSVLGIYLVGSMVFSKRLGLIASLLYGTSPLAIYYMRLPYHTSPIPLFVIALIFSLYKIVQNKPGYLPLAIFLLAILYNFEIATVVLWGVLISILIYKFFKDRKSFRQIFNKKIIIFLLFSLVTPLLPIILYDVKNGFPQTLKFTVWSFYRAVSLFSYNAHQGFLINKIIIMVNFLFDNFRKLIFVQSSLISFVILVSIVGWSIYVFFRKKNYSSYNLVFLLLFIPLVFVILNQIPSDAYLPIFFPVMILLLSLFLDDIMSRKKMFVPISVFLIVLIVGNINFMLKNDFVFDKSSRLFALDKRVQAAHKILNIAQNKDYNLKGKGPESKFNSFTMNYEYLTWWLGHTPSKKNELIKIYVSESASGIKVESKIND